MATKINANGHSGVANVLLSFFLGATSAFIGIVSFFMWDNYKSHQAAPTAIVTMHSG